MCFFYVVRGYREKQAEIITDGLKAAVYQQTLEIS